MDDNDDKIVMDDNEDQEDFRLCRRLTSLDRDPV